MTNKEAYAKCVKERIGTDKNHGWGNEDSYQGILAVVANETGTEVKDLDTAEFGHLIKTLINPSQFRQGLEKNGLLNESQGKRTKSGLNDLLKSL